MSVVDLTSSPLRLTHAIPRRPPGPYFSSSSLPAVDLDSDDDHDDDDDDVQLLAEAPEHMRKRTNIDNPIRLDSSDDEEYEPGPSRKRQRLSSRTASEWTATCDSSERRSTEATRPPVGKSVDPPPTPEHLLPLVLEVLPDLESEWALASLNGEISNGNLEGAVAKVVEMALELEGGYPRATVAGKGKEKEKHENAQAGALGKEQRDYRDVTWRMNRRRGAKYRSRSLAGLEEEFGMIPVPHIRRTFTSQDSLFAPTFFLLTAHSAMGIKPFVELKRSRTAKGKGRAPDDIDEQDSGAEGVWDEGEREFWRERTWLFNHIEKEKQIAEEAEAKKRAHAAALANGHGMECQCCFGEELMENMIQCQEGHLFCRECATRHAEIKLGEQSVAINCMDGSACPAPFPESELARILPSKALNLYHRLKQAKDLELAAIEGLEQCPSCPYAAVIDNPDEKLFRCENLECGIISCRKCKRKEHIPRTCEEVEADRKADRRHVVEDAMSEALIRKCPKCEKPYIKDSGCNKIYCLKCGTLSCYICGKAIQSYEHFDQNPAAYSQGTTPGKCMLWDKEEAKHENDRVLAARAEAQREVRARAEAEGITLDENDLAVEHPEHVAGPRAVPARAGIVPAGVRPGLPAVGHGLAALPPPRYMDRAGAAAAIALRPADHIRQQPPIPPPVVGGGLGLPGEFGGRELRRMRVREMGEELNRRREEEMRRIEGLLPPGLPREGLRF